MLRGRQAGQPSAEGEPVFEQSGSPAVAVLRLAVFCALNDIVGSTIGGRHMPGEIIDLQAQRQAVAAAKATAMLCDVLRDASRGRGSNAGPVCRAPGNRYQFCFLS